MSNIISPNINIDCEFCYRVFQCISIKGVLLKKIIITTIHIMTCLRLMFESIENIFFKSAVKRCNYYTIKYAHRHTHTDARIQYNLLNLIKLRSNNTKIKKI